MLLLLGLADAGRDGFRTQEVVLAVAGKAKPDVLINSKRFALRRRNFPRTIASPRLLSNT
jgi:hypothetical protein